MMGEKVNQKVSDVLSASPTLQELAQKISQLEQLDKTVKEHLPPGYAQHCRVANIKGGRLILATTGSTGNAMNSLRYHFASLLNKLRKEPKFAGLASIELQVLPDLITTTTNQRPPALWPRPNQLTEKNRQLLREVAKQTSCKKLADSINKLANSKTTKTKS